MPKRERSTEELYRYLRGKLPVGLTYTLSESPLFVNLEKLDKAIQIKIISLQSREKLRHEAIDKGQSLTGDIRFEEIKEIEKELQRLRKMRRAIVREAQAHAKEFKLFKPERPKIKRYKRK